MPNSVIPSPWSISRRVSVSLLKLADSRRLTTTPRMSQFDSRKLSVTSCTIWTTCSRVRFLPLATSSTGAIRLWASSALMSNSSAAIVLV